MKCKRILVTFLIVSLLAALSLCCTVFAGNTTEFLDGSGAQADPYLIADSTHLQNVKNYPSACFKLVKDLSVSNMGLTTFTGTFDGGGHIISNLYYNLADSKSNGTNRAIGLFAKNNGVIRNLTLDKVSLYAQASGQSKKSILGGIAAESTSYGRFENCHVTSGTITAQTYYNPNWGGFVGYYASEATADGISVTLEIDADAREYIFLLAGYRNGRMITCHMVTQPKNTSIAHTFTRLREGDIVQVFVLEDGFAPVISATPVL